MSINECMDIASLAMDSSIESLEKALSGIRTGRADPGLLDSIKVDAYGAMMPLNQVSTVTAEGASCLKITPWDKSQLSIIEKAIRVSDIGLQPNSDGYCIRINLPPMTEERRLEYVKLAKSSGEKAKVSVRTARREFISEIKNLVKDKLLTEDDDHRAQAEIQKLTDKYIDKVDALISVKEKELLEV